VDERNIIVLPCVAGGKKAAALMAMQHKFIKAGIASRGKARLPVGSSVPRACFRGQPDCRQVEWPARGT
jgi:hypothetical protein